MCVAGSGLTFLWPRHRLSRLLSPTQLRQTSRTKADGRANDGGEPWLRRASEPVQAGSDKDIAKNLHDNY